MRADVDTVAVKPLRLTIGLLALPASLGIAAAQPADCASYPAATQTIPLQLDLAGLPGVPKGIAGQLYADVPAPPPGGAVCGSERRSGRVGNMLAGPGGDVLGGAPAADLLRGR